MPYSLPIDLSEYNRRISRLDDKKASRLLLTELETRITGRHLSFRSGNEQQIASDVIEFLKRTREIALEYSNAPRFRIIALCTINSILAPHSDRWSAWLPTNFFDSFDNCRIFRQELNELSVALTRIQGILRLLIEGKQLTGTDLLVNIPVFTKGGVPRIRSANANRKIQSGIRAGTLEPDEFAAQLKRHISVLRQLCDESIDQTVVLPIRIQLDGIEADAKEQQIAPSCSARTQACREIAESVVALGEELVALPIFILASQRILELLTASERSADGLRGETTEPIETRINEAEWASLQQKRGPSTGVFDESIPTNVAGLALSGGGIRSATFALGVCQCLSKHGMFQHFDYISTVSGGGYLGSYISAHAHDLAEKGEQSQSESLILHERISSSDADDRHYVRHLRNHSKAMSGQGLAGAWQSLHTALIGMASTLLAALTMMSFLALPAWASHHIRFWGDWQRESVYSYLGGLSLQIAPNPALGIALWLIIAAIFLNLFIQPLAKFLFNHSKLYSLNKLTNAISILAFSVALIASVPVLFIAVIKLRETRFMASLSMDEWSLIGSGLVAFFSSSRILKAKSKANVIRRLLSFVSAFAGVIFLGLLFAYVFALAIRMELSFGVRATAAWLMIMQLWLGVHLLLLDPNLRSLHRIYRNRLCACYLFFGKKSTKVPKLSVLQSNAPFHLINCTANLHGSGNAELRGRNGDFFYFSKHYSGSRLTGYHATTEFEADDERLDLGTAMAISGAAFSSSMGNQHASKHHILLTLLNVRLGYWLRNLNRPSHHLLRGPVCFAKELFGAMKENDWYLNLSDGGHIENLGVYELLRRRCKFILSVDGECDPQMNFNGLIKIMRYAQIDLGVDIQIDLSDLEKVDESGSKSHSLFGKIIYPDDSIGWFLYIKLSMTGDEHPYVKDYQLEDEAFPHQSTLDQLYSERQFEAYRRLGEHAAEDLFRSSLLQCNPRLEPVSGDQAGPLKTWFETLAMSLLPDNDPVFREDTGGLSGLQVWLSTGNIAQNIELNSPSSIEDATAEIARRVIGQGGAIVSGHDWREGGVMQTLAEFARGDRMINGRIQPAIVNVLRTNRTGNPTEQLMKENGVVHVIDVDSNALGNARETMAESSDVCVCVGGKLAGYTGDLPGVIDEAWRAAKLGICPIICPCLGGAARWIADVLRGVEPSFQLEENKTNDNSDDIQAESILPKIIDIGDVLRNSAEVELHEELWNMNSPSQWNESLELINRILVSIARRKPERGKSSSATFAT